MVKKKKHTITGALFINTSWPGIRQIKLGKKLAENQSCLQVQVWDNEINTTLSSWAWLKKPKILSFNMVTLSLSCTFFLTWRKASDKFLLAWSSGMT